MGNEYQLAGKVTTGLSLRWSSFTYIHTHTHTQPLYSSLNFVWDNPGKPVPEEIFTHSHLLWSSIVPYLLRPCNTIFGILPVQSMCLTVFFHNLQVFFGLPLGLAPSTSYSIHFFTLSLSSLRSTCPFHRNLFCCSSQIVAIVHILCYLLWT